MPVVCLRSNSIAFWQVSTLMDLIEFCRLNFSSVDILQMYWISDSPGPFYERDREMKDIFLKMITFEKRLEAETNNHGIMQELQAWNLHLGFKHSENITRRTGGVRHAIYFLRYGKASALGPLKLQKRQLAKSRQCFIFEQRGGRWPHPGDQGSSVGNSRMCCVASIREDGRPAASLSGVGR